MRGSNVGRGEHAPLRIKPELGKVAKDVGEPKRKVSSDVLEEGERGSGLGKNAPNLGPEVARIV